MTAMQVLAKYNIMGLGLGIGVATMAQMRQDPGMQQQQMMQSQPRYDMPNQMMGGPMGSMMDQPGDRNDSVISYNYSYYDKMVSSESNYTHQH